MDSPSRNHGDLRDNDTPDFSPHEAGKNLIARLCCSLPVFLMSISIKSRANAVIIIASSPWA
jgi:hypothetical protein